jgi:glycosyltransferase involved in cell wall biosynthesis
VGYGGGPDHTKLLNSLVGPVIAEVARTETNFRLHVVGPKPDFLGKLPVRTEYTGYIPNYYDYLTFASKLEWDIGLAPQWDSEFTTYKFYNKLLEYTHIGCAAIYTRIEPYVGVIEDGVTGLLVPNEVEAWRDAIIRLLRDARLRFKIASNAYEFVKSHHNKAVVTERYAAALTPFLSYRAPQLSNTYLLWSDQVGRFSRVYKAATEHVRAYGTRRFLRRALQYALSSLHRRMTAPKSKDSVRT